LHDARLVYRELLAIDEAGKTAYIAGSEDPTEIQIYRLSLASERPPERMTTEPGMHSAEFSRQGTNWVDTVMPRSGVIEQVLRHGDGKALATLVSKAEIPGIDLHVEWTTVTDDAFRSLLVRPRDFAAGKKYPVIVHVYGGPHSQMVTAAGNRYVLDQWLADQGYVVVSIDGRGTPGRTRDWERAIRGNLIDAPLDDQVRALQALGAKYPELDLNRVGIFGWSFGGYFSAMATSRRPDVFQVGVAGAPVTDWRDYDSHYTERYLGLPDANPGGYDGSSALVSAPQLKRPLLLIHGTADDNVYFFHSLKLSSALFRAGREHEFLPLVGMTHMVTEPTANEMLYERILSYFDAHLKK
jgi:dipeptidyl-peptidase-4